MIKEEYFELYDAAIGKIGNEGFPIDEVSIKTLLVLIEYCNYQYRAGSPIVSDDFYDHTLLAELRRRDPDHEFLQKVEPEPELIEGKTVPLPARMLSTNKAYSIEEIEKWANDVVRVGVNIGLNENEVFFRITPKLDGFAAYFDSRLNPGQLITRGNGYRGTDISHALRRGIEIIGGYTSIKGPGEIVLSKEYFAERLKDKFENSRNVIAAVIKEGDLDPDIQGAIMCGAVVFYPFQSMNAWVRDKIRLLESLEEIWDDNLKTCAYDTDGLVIEVINIGIKREMGHTNHHHRWQIAYKKNTEFHDIEVTGLQWQTAKTGRITPVVLLKPTKVSGATISRATGHHYGNVSQNRIGKGAIVKVCRSGLVIPYIETVVKGADVFSHPGQCSSCGADAVINGDNLYCTNEVNCPAQIERTIEYFFKTVGNCDGFGPKVIEKLCTGTKRKMGIRSVVEIYRFVWNDFVDLGISEGVASNLRDELDRSQREPIEDWRFLAAFSIPNVGRGGCEKLLKHHRLKDVFTLTVEEIVQIDGFAKKTATILVNALKVIKPQFDALVDRFNLIETSRGDTKIESPIAGKTMVFTGTMQKGSRDDMKKQAKTLGAKVSDSVSSKTDYLVCGTNVGASKTSAAEKHGIKVLTEDEYLKMVTI